MNFLPKALLLVLVLLSNASCQTTNPGAYAFLVRPIADRTKAQYWPDIIVKISTISIPEGTTGSGVLINLTLDPGSAVLRLDEANNTSTPVIKNIALAGTAEFLVRYGFTFFWAP